MKFNRPAVLIAAFFLAVGILLFLPLARPGVFLLTTDDNIGELAMRSAGLPQGWLGWWSDAQLLGVEGYVNINLTYLLLWALPVVFYANWFHAICLVLAAVFLALFLRERGVSLPAGLLAGLTFAWVGSNFTLTYAGHIPKFAVLTCAAACLWCIEKAVKERSVAWACLAGGTMGGMFLEIQDLALFFALFIGPYAIHAMIREHGLSVRPALPVLVPLLLVAGVTAARPVWDGYRTQVQGIASVSEENPGAKWEFATQWSWPPEETVDFIAPGYMGWRSGEAKGPYWGRMGRSAGWSLEQPQGFRNFKLEGQYIGAIPVVFALFAFAAAWAGRKPGQQGIEERPVRWDIYFWGAVTVLALLLSFGKFFPLYKLFYQLPVVNSIRNPNKFLQVFQLGLAVLAAYGLDPLLKRKS